jgi:predicted amidohydrolase YtcJ
VKGHVYTLSWDEPALDGTPAPSAPHSAEGWKPDAEAVAIRDGKILAVGTSEDIAHYAAETTKTLDAGEATVIPGLIDSHTHVAGLGELESQVSLFGVKTEEEALQRGVDAASSVPEGSGSSPGAGMTAPGRAAIPPGIT